jgi:ERCC4-related helicase
MATLHQQIADKFLAKLADSKDVDAGKIEQLRSLLADGKKIKADEFVKIFTQSDSSDFK